MVYVIEIHIIRIHWFLSLPTILCAHSKSLRSITWRRKIARQVSGSFYKEKALIFKSIVNSVRRKIFQRFDGRMNLKYLRRKTIFLLSHLLRDVKTFSVQNKYRKQIQNPICYETETSPDFSKYFRKFLPRRDVDKNRAEKGEENNYSLISSFFAGQPEKIGKPNNDAIIDVWQRGSFSLVIPRLMSVISNRNGRKLAIRVNVLKRSVLCRP